MSHELLLRHQRELRAFDVVLSGFHSSIGLWGQPAASARARERAAAMLEQMGIAVLADRVFTAMSAGEQRRCLLARALVNDPPALLLDEPTVSLDLAGAIRFREFLLSLKREGKTIVFTSHTLADVERLADRVAILVDGRLVALESVESLKRAGAEISSFVTQEKSLEDIYLHYINGQNAVCENSK